MLPRMTPSGPIGPQSEPSEKAGEPHRCGPIGRSLRRQSVGSLLFAGFETVLSHGELTAHPGGIAVWGSRMFGSCYAGPVGFL